MSQSDDLLDANDRVRKAAYFLRSDIRIVVQVKPPCSLRFFTVNKDAKWFMGRALTLQVLKRALAHIQDRLKDRLERQTKWRAEKVPPALQFHADKLVVEAKRDHKRLETAIDELGNNPHENFYAAELAELEAGETAAEGKRAAADAGRLKAC